MNKKLENALMGVLEKAIDIAEKTGDFAIEQAPLLLQEFYRWHIAKNILLIVIWSIIWYIIFNSCKLFSLKELTGNQKEGVCHGEYKKRFGRYFLVNSYYEPSDSLVFAYVSKGMSVLCLIPVNIFLYQLLFVLISPKLYLIEYFINR